MKLTAKQVKRVFLPEDQDGAWVDIIYLKKGIRVLIEQEGNVMTATQRNGEFTPLLEMSRKAKRKMFFKELIEDWGGFQDPHANELPLNDASIELVVREIPTFHKWLQEESDKFIEETEKEVNKSLKN